MVFGRKVLTKSGVAISRTCCFPCNDDSSVESSLDGICKEHLAVSESQSDDTTMALTNTILGENLLYSPSEIRSKMGEFPTAVAKGNMQLRNRQLGNLEQSEYQLTLQTYIVDFVVAFRTAVASHEITDRCMRSDAIFFVLCLQIDACGLMRCGACGLMRCGACCLMRTK